MRKVIGLALVVLVLMSSFVMAGDWANRTLLSAATVTGTVSTAFTPAFPPKYVTCVNVWSGTTPTNTVATVEVSLDKTTWYTLGAITATAATTTANLATGGTIFNHIRGTYTSRSNGDATTAVTLKCLISH